MKIFLFSTSPRGAGKRLEKILKWALPAVEIEIYRTIETLTARLTRTKGDFEVGLLLANNSDELRHLSLIRDCLEYLRIILILLDNRPEMFSEGHKLRPRFITDTGCGFVDVVAVLSKMLEKNRVGTDPGRRCSQTTPEAGLICATRTRESNIIDDEQF